MIVAFVCVCVRVVVVVVVVVAFIVCLLLFVYVPKMRQQSDNISLETGWIQENETSAQTSHPMEPLLSWLKVRTVKIKQVVRTSLN